MKKIFLIIGLGSVVMGAASLYLYNKLMKELEHMDFNNLTVDKIDCILIITAGSYS